MTTGIYTNMKYKPIKAGFLRCTDSRYHPNMNDDSEIEVLEYSAAQTAPFTIGFAKIEKHDGEETDAIAAGSGALVSIGNIKGILTAAHVLDCLPKTGLVGLIRFNSSPMPVQKLKFEMQHTDCVRIAHDLNKPTGPDIGFLRLESNVISTLEARSGIFFNLDKRRASTLNSDNAIRPYFDAVSGVVAEWSSDLPLEHLSSRVKGFRALFGAARIVREYESDRFDLCDFEVSYEDGHPSPDTYGGMSGGALWRIYCSKDSNGRISFKDKKIIGVVFRQTEITDKKRNLICHGYRSVYGNLIDAVKQKWPDTI